MIIGLVSDFLPECKSKISFGLFIHHAGIFGVKVLSMFLKFMFADSRTEPSLNTRREKLSLQYAIRIAENNSNPAHDVTFQPKYTDLYESKPNFLFA